MIIELKKFGTTLTSRQIGKESFAAFTPTLNEITSDEKVYVDFSGVNTFSPSWGDEFLTQLFNRFGSRLILKQTENPSVNTTISILEETNDIKFIIE
jgi:hypothetical protein